MFSHGARKHEESESPLAIG